MIKLHYPRFAQNMKYKAMCGVYEYSDGRGTGEIQKDFLGASKRARCALCERVLRKMHPADKVTEWIVMNGGEV